jgi:hypothetical protein
MQPSIFYGTAVSTCLGLTLGLALHGPWQSRPGGPQILSASAAAAELARPANDADLIETAAPTEIPAYADLSVADTGQLPADPLPVTRLTRRGGGPIRAREDVQSVTTEPLDQEMRDDEASGLQKEIADAESSSRFASPSLASLSYSTSDIGY